MSAGLLKTPWGGALTLEVRDGFVTALRAGPPESGTVEAPEDVPLLRRAELELEEYWAGVRWTFDLPLTPCGTPFQISVWRALLEIPYGETRSYGQLARALGRPGAARAVGGACHRNPFLILVPCHRAVGASGALTGFAAGLPLKAALLKLEQSSKNRVDAHGCQDCL